MNKTKKLLALLAVAVFSVLLVPKQAVAEGNTLVIADFSGHPNNLGGDVGVYGSLEPNWGDKASPYSWYYGPSTAGYDPKNVHSGNQSFRLVNGLGAKKGEAWGSFSMDLGRTVNIATTPKEVESKDVTKYKYLTFWVKGEKGGEKMALVFRDSHAPSYMPQAKLAVAEATTKWVKISVPLKEIQKQGVDLKALDNISIAFGPDVRNKQGAIVYIDDFAFTSSQQADRLKTERRILR